MSISSSNYADYANGQRKQWVKVLNIILQAKDTNPHDIIEATQTVVNLIGDFRFSE